MLADFLVRPGSPAEALLLESAIPEFASPHSLSEYEARLSAENLILIATSQGRPAGFKVGYALSDTIFYSWLGGVLPEFRRNNVASELLVTQEDWARANGFTHIRVKSRNRFPAMLIFLIKSGYSIVGTEPRPGEQAILFERKITSPRSTVLPTSL